MKSLNTPLVISSTPTGRMPVVDSLKGLIIIPAFNEEANIAQTIDELRLFPQTIAFDILVISDGSRDQTAAVARRAGAFVVELPLNLGIGGAVQTGFQFACAHNYDYVIRVDGDGQHNPEYLKAIFDPVFSQAADMTIGSRFLPPFTSYRSSWIRRIGIGFFAQLISFITEYKITDPTSGFCVFNKRMIEMFARKFPHDYPEPEAIVWAGRYHARVQEVPVQMRKRAKGHSSIRYFKTLYYMVKVTFAVLLAKIKRKESITA